jgi:hypothetical protein
VVGISIDSKKALPKNAPLIVVTFGAMVSQSLYVIPAFLSQPNDLAISSVSVFEVVAL